jgi:hypothetical protein
MRTGNIETEHANTTITGRTGEFFLVGGVTEKIKRSQSGTASYSSTKSNHEEFIQMKKWWLRPDWNRGPHHYEYGVAI